MTFKEWENKNEQLIADGTYDFEDIWHIAQQNYPYAICDEKMEQTMRDDLTSNYYLSKDQIKVFIDNYAPSVINEMWNTYDTTVEKFIDKNKHIFRAI